MDNEIVLYTEINRQGFCGRKLHEAGAEKIYLAFVHVKRSSTFGNVWISMPIIYMIMLGFCRFKTLKQGMCFCMLSVAYSAHVSTICKYSGYTPGLKNEVAMSCRILNS